MTESPHPPRQRFLARPWTLPIGLLAIALACRFSSSGNGGTLTQFRFEGLGFVHVELFDEDKPGTVSNFINLTRAGAYQFTFVHRLVPGFVAQGGGFRTVDPTSTTPIGPPYDNLLQVPNFGPIANEFDVGPRVSNTYGTIAMAKLGGDPDSATSQWFFNLNDNGPQLDPQNGGFTVFGRVVGAGTNILNQLNQVAPGRNLVNLQDTYGVDDNVAGIFTSLPTFQVGTGPPPYNQLIYTTISVAALQAEPAAEGAMRLVWNSAGGVTNCVEFTDQLSGPWNTLVKTNGTGGVMSAIDSKSPSTPQRFYRLKVEF